MSSLSLLTIDLQAIANNWQLLSNKVGVESQCAAVVKANAYGLGIGPVSQVLFGQGCRIFFVATLTEGVELRLLLPRECQIIIFGGLFYDVDASCSSVWLEYSLTPVLFSVEHLQRWLAFSRKQKKILPSIVKIDTGMHRTGIAPDEFQAQCVNGNVLALQPTYIMGHFACADELKHPLNKIQIDVFAKCLRHAKSVFPQVKATMCNSSAVFLEERAHFDLVRPGLALYGGNPCLNDKNPMQRVVSLQLTIMQIKWIEKDEIVGYGASYKAVKRTRLAIVSGGYADGLLRCLSNVGFAFCCGKKVPIVGRVSMDTMVFDITSVPNESPSVVDIIGEEQSLEALANAAGTVSYELLTSLSHRFQRHYIEPL